MFGHDLADVAARTGTRGVVTDQPGEFNLDDQAALRSRPCADRALVRRDSGADDGQAQAHAAAVAGAVGAEPAERLEQRRAPSSAGTGGPVLRTASAGLVRGRYFYLGPAAGLVVVDRVRHQVGDQPLQQDGVAGDRAARSACGAGVTCVLGGQLLVRVDHGCPPARPAAPAPCPAGRGRFPRAPAGPRSAARCARWCAAAGSRAGADPGPRPGRPSPPRSAAAGPPAGCAARARRSRRTGAGSRSRPPAGPARRRSRRPAP